MLELRLPAVIALLASVICTPCIFAMGMDHPSGWIQGTAD